MNAFERLKEARHAGRPTGAAYVAALFENRLDLCGDRRFGEDPAIISGIGTLSGRPVTYIAIDKGADLDSRMRNHFGCPMPEGYRKALRLMKQAEKFHRPVICLVDTLGAYCGAEAEERGQGEAIAENILEMMGLRTPVISVVIGEGGSGGALALAAALCIVAAACGTKNNAPDTPAKTDTPTAAPGGTQTVGDTGDGTVREDGSYVPGQVDRLRLTYNGNVSSALYVTSAAQLPDYPELSAYDDAFFKDHALVLVQESVSSGSVEVGIESVSLKADHTAVVALTHQGPGEGQVGTADMATWLLWTEVDTGLEDYQWTVANPALESQLSQY